MKKGYYFTTRDLLFIAGFSAIGGLASTYINMIGDFFQSLLGFAGTTQWAAGLHILWILLAVGIVNKPGTAVLTGVLKGLVELLSGNTHGVLVLIVDVVAGLVVELIFYFPILSSLWKNILAGGLAAASNVFVFQIFASVPSDSLAFWSLLVVGGMAFLSGVVFGGIISQIVIKNLAKTGIISQPMMGSKVHWTRVGFVLLGVLLCAVFAFVYTQTAKGAGEVVLSGNVTADQIFNAQTTTITPISVESELQGMAGTYTGYPIKDILAQAGAGDDSDLILVTATDGYSYFITMDEVRSNPHLILVASGEGKDASYSVVGATNSKAWVRGVAELTVFQSVPVPISMAGNVIAEFHPQHWQFDMDSVYFELETGSKKLQGVAVYLVLDTLTLPTPYEQAVFSNGNDNITLDKVSIEQDDTIRIFVNIDGYSMNYLLGTLQGQVLLDNVNSITLQ
ncbi:MAG: ECF transporter S component [Chloroflexi bacterium]|nr:ECF transporter S component [Chloroflexota bacterium]